MRLDSSGHLSLVFTRKQLAFAAMLLLDALYALTLALPGNWASVPVRNCVLFTLPLFLALQAAGVIDCARRDTQPTITLATHKSLFLQFLFFQSAFYVYWSFYFPPGFARLGLIAIQLVFGCLFDMALSWIVLRNFRFGFAVFPIVGSINLFLWFRPEWFGLQLLVVALALVSKVVFVRHPREGAAAHIFNPSGIALAAAGIILSAMQPTAIAYGQDIPETQELGPHVCELLFAISLLVNIWFPTVLITASTFLTLVALHHLTALFFGLPFYPVPVLAPYFLGGTLLLTDPATSPRSGVGKVIYGAAYGALCYLTPPLLFALDRPTGPEKVVAVPILNLLVDRIDRAGSRLGALALGIVPWLARPLKSHRVHVGAWIAIYIWMAPGIRTATLQLLENPHWATLTPEAAKAKADSSLLCINRPPVCRTGGILEEAEYLFSRKLAH